jgi:hypothetical protein
VIDVHYLSDLMDLLDGDEFFLDYSLDFWHLDDLGAGDGDLDGFLFFNDSIPKDLHSLEASFGDQLFDDNFNIIWHFLDGFHNSGDDHYLLHYFFHLDNFGHFDYLADNPVDINSDFLDTF